MIRNLTSVLGVAVLLGVTSPLMAQTPQNGHGGAPYAPSKALPAAQNGHGGAPYAPSKALPAAQNGHGG